MSGLRNQSDHVFSTGEGRGLVEIVLVQDGDVRANHVISAQYTALSQICDTGREGTEEKTKWGLGEEQWLDGEEG